MLDLSIRDHCKDLRSPDRPVCPGSVRHCTQLFDCERRSPPIVGQDCHLLLHLRECRDNMSILAAASRKLGKSISKTPWKRRPTVLSFDV